MIKKNKCIVIDIDGTICPLKRPEQSYRDLKPISAVVKKLDEYKKNGFYIIFYTSRNMRTYDGNLGLINAKTSKEIISWLDTNQIYYDEIYFGKPWPGVGGFYVDDKAIRPDEFLKLNYDEINNLINWDWKTMLLYHHQKKCQSN